jgi:hypothetical protein
MEKTYKRLRKDSMVCITAHDKNTMRQVIVKARFLQREFGINVARPSFA